MNRWFLTFALFAALFVMVPSSVAVQSSATGVPAAEVKKPVEYPLPYPGILPDHPLYVLKALRDLVLDILIVDPVRSAEFYILQADKRLAMGMVLVDQNKAALAEQIVSKGEKYMHQAVYGLLSVKTEDNPIPPYVTDRLTLALAKHKELLTALIAKTTEPQKAGFAGSLELVATLSTEAEKLK